MTETHGKAGKPKILLIDDSRAVREEIKALLLKRDLDAVFFEAATGLEGFKILLDHPMDLVLCDLVMPQFDGFKFLQMRGSRPELHDTPVLMLTAIEEIGQKVRILTSGATDYITKPFHHEELVARVRIHLKIKHLQDELRQKNALLLALSTTDSLTKTYNRRHFMELARKEFERSERQGFQLSLLIFDVDYFKEINDTYGHQAGDTVLIELCHAAEESLRDYDILGRYGGDEFTILFPQTTLNQAMSVAQRFEKAVKAIELEVLKGKRLSVSGGVSHKSSGIQDIEKLVKAADEALYRAKQAGRGRILSCE
jgi:two-component system cell cycle response regulator